MDGGDEQAGERQRAQFFRHVDDLARKRSCPAVRDHAAIPDIGRDENLVRVSVRETSEPIGVLERAGADDDRARTACDQVFHVARASNAAANLNLRRYLAKQLVDSVAVRSPTRGGVEVDHVQPPEAILRPLTGDGNRIRQTNALVGVIAANELNARALAQVHRGNGDHRVASSRKA
jgi:hypothetical protein